MLNLESYVDKYVNIKCKTTERLKKLNVENCEEYFGNNEIDKFKT